MFASEIPRSARDTGVWIYMQKRHEGASGNERTEPVIPLSISLPGWCGLHYYFPMYFYIGHAKPKRIDEVLYTYGKHVCDVCVCVCAVLSSDWHSSDTDS